jgi:hypothetical protein
MSMSIDITALQAGVIKAQTAIETELEFPGVCENPATVRVTAGITKNMGNYNSLKVEVAVSVPCHPTRVEETTALLKEFVGATAKAMLAPKTPDAEESLIRLRDGEERPLS